MMELKLCPFCGNKKVVVRHKYITDRSVIRSAYFYAKCTKCHARGKPIVGSYRESWVCEPPKWAGEYREKEYWEEKAIEAWNRRANDGTEKKTD